MKNREFFIVQEDCPGIMTEIWDYRRNEKGQVLKVNDHYMAALRYGIYSFKIPPKIDSKPTIIKPITSGLEEEIF